MGEKQVQALRPLLTTSDVAKMFSVHKETILRAIRNKNPNFPQPINISSSPKRASYRFIEDEVYRFIANMK